MPPTTEVPMANPASHEPKLPENRLPDHVLQRASLRGGEYAWPVEAIGEVLVAARDAGLACLGGQAQLRLPDATCEMYWHSLDPADRRPSEGWTDFVHRTAAEALSQWDEVRGRIDVSAEAQRWQQVPELRRDPLAAERYLCFVLYFQGEG
jgi:hypothetical protein